MEDFPNILSDSILVVVVTYLQFVLNVGMNRPKPFGFNSMVTMQSWMSISSFEKMRENIILNYDIFTLLHMESMVLGIAFVRQLLLFVIAE